MKLADHITARLMSRMECFVCGSVQTFEGAPSKTARFYRKAGWRILVSGKFNTRGPMCPRCAGVPDRLR